MTFAAAAAAAASRHTKDLITGAASDHLTRDSIVAPQSFNLNAKNER